MSDIIEWNGQNWQFKYKRKAIEAFAAKYNLKFIQDIFPKFIDLAAKMNFGEFDFMVQIGLENEKGEHMTISDVTEFLDKSKYSDMQVFSFMYKALSRDQSLPALPDELTEIFAESPETEKKN